MPPEGPENRAPDVRRDRILYYVFGLMALALIVAGVLFRADLAGDARRPWRYAHAAALGLAAGACLVFAIRVCRRLGRWWWF